MTISSSSCCQCNTSLGYRVISDEQSKKICVPPCYSPYFSDEHSKSMINIWLTFLSVLCAASCAFVLLTFFIDITRFKYPQRPIIFLALCYFFVSCGYLIRLTLGHENVACRRSDLEVSRSDVFGWEKKMFIVLLGWIYFVFTIDSCFWSIELCLCICSNLFLRHGLIDLVGYINFDMVSCCRL